ncbi:MAG: cyclic nucleotide-binding domain-containing protein, partial [Thiobacillus sp.]
MNENRSFYENYPTVKFSKGEIILHQDEVPKYVYVVKSGVVEALNFTHSGDYRSISFAIADDIL